MGGAGGVADDRGRDVVRLPSPHYGAYPGAFSGLGPVGVSALRLPRIFAEIDPESFLAHDRHGESSAESGTSLGKHGENTLKTLERIWPLIGVLYTPDGIHYIKQMFRWLA